MSSLEKISVEELPFVGRAYKEKLNKLGIETIWDLFHHIPFRFLDFSKVTSIANLELGEIATITGSVVSFTNEYTKKGKAMQIVSITDNSGKVSAIWFNQIYLSKTFKKGAKVSIAGELNWFGRQKAIISPEYEVVKENTGPIHTGRIIPMYPGTAGITSKWLRRKIFDAWKKYSIEIEEFLPDHILEKYNLLSLILSLEYVHFPKNLDDFSNGKRRLAFNELVNLHLKNIKNKKTWVKNKANKIKNYEKEIKDFIKKLPFELTLSQEKVVMEILSDIEKDTPMNRLLEGDVGSGKTVVAAIAAYQVALNNKKTILMAPTQILASQHLQTLKGLFKDKKIKIGVWTGNKKDEGEFDILIGTHALLSRKFNINETGLVIIDEQHKFGVRQRTALISKGKAPHVLTMTATPIPRTVALTFFGDLDLSILNELPKRRQKVTTWVVPEEKRKKAYEWIDKEITINKSQVFIVCPLIENSETETLKDVKNVNDEFKKIEKIFMNRKIGLLHGKLKPKEKDEVIDKFKAGKLDILVTTPVVEVGMDIPNASIMMIEASDRFGLASLHQLRGRVGRGEKKSYCLLMSESKSEKAIKRLKALSTNHSGFELAEIDLTMRGPGEIYGTRQSGIPELRIATWNDLELIKEAREAVEYLENKVK